jgi:hypothetical protein
MMEREFIIKWLDKVFEQPLHAKVYIPAESKEDSTKLKKAFRDELDILYKIEPEKASTVLLGAVFKDRRFWVVLERVTGNALVGFVRNPDGTMERVKIDFDPERDRRIELMKEAGWTLEQIEQMEGPLTEEEKHGNN